MIAARAAERLDQAFGALAHPVRRRILEATIRKGRGVTELTEQFDVSLAAVSKHVKVLPVRRGDFVRQLHRHSATTGPLVCAPGWRCANAGSSSCRQAS